MKIGFSRQIFEKKSRNMKFYENPSSGNRVVPCGRVAGHDEANFANAFKNEDVPKDVQCCKRNIDDY